MILIATSTIANAISASTNVLAMETPLSARMGGAGPRPPSLYSLPHVLWSVTAVEPVLNPPCREVDYESRYRVEGDSLCIFQIGPPPSHRV